MRLPRFRIGRLMALMIPFGVTLAALIRPNRGAATLLSTFLFTALLSAILGAILRRGAARGFWLGFAVFGWSLVLLAGFGKNDTDYIINFFPFETISMVAQGLLLAANPDRETILEFFHWSGQVGDYSQTRVILSAVDLAFAYLGGRIGRHLAGDQPAVGPPPDDPAARLDRIAATR